MRQMRYTISYKVPYEGKHPTLKEFFSLTNEMKITNQELSKMFDVSDGAVSSWRHDRNMPYQSTLEKMKAFIAEHKGKTDEPEQTTIPEAATLVDRQPPKDKRDGEVLTYRIDTPWKTERPKPKSNSLIDKLLEQFGEETVTKAVLGNLTKDQLIEFIRNGGTK